MQNYNLKILQLFSCPKISSGALPKRPDLSTKLENEANTMAVGGTAADDSTWDTRTDAE